MEWKDKKVLVNGAKGFIGYNLSKKLIGLGSEVYSINRLSPESKEEKNLECWGKMILSMR